MLVKAPILWITGIPASGKTTLAEGIVGHFRRLGQPAEIVDGEDVRKVVSSGLGFSRSDRLENCRRIAWIARILARNGVLSVVASVSPYLEGRAEARREAEMVGLKFMEIYLSCEVSVASKRDVKNLYAVRKDVTGMGAPYEVSRNPEIMVETDKFNVSDTLSAVLKRLACIS